MTHHVFQDLIGKPYALGITGPEAYDCWTLVLEVYRRLGRNVSPLWLLHDATGLDRRQIVRAFIDGASTAGVVKTDVPKDYDFVCDLRRGHVGLWLSPGKVLHASKAHGHVVQERIQSWLISFPNTEYMRCLN